MQRETSTTVKEDNSLKIGVSLSGSYGGMVDFKSSLEQGHTSSKEESAKHATRYSKEVTTRSVAKVTEKVREQKILKLTEEIEETNSHGLDNTAGPDHIVGIYQWVDKIYEAQVFNYGNRVLYDVVVPEPAAFYIAAMARHQSEGEALVKPQPFQLLPYQLNAVNYMHLSINTASPESSRRPRRTSHSRRHSMTAGRGRMTSQAS